MKQHSITTAFTLIELLVVISIIAILAGIALPVYQTVMIGAQQTDALANAKQIGLALKVFANDANGNFPQGKNSYDEPIITSNDAFRSLVPNYSDDEKIFTSPRSKTGSKADNKTATPAEILAAGENHFAYVEGLTTTSNSNWPLIVDHTDGSGKYTTTEGAIGGTWRGAKAVVVRTDGSGAIVRLKGTGASRYLPRFDDDNQNGLQVREYMGDGVKLLEPARP